MQAQFRIKVTHPGKYYELLDEWSSSNIKDLENYSYGSGYKAQWICRNCKSIFMATIAKRAANGHNCPYCAGRQVNNTNSLAVKHPDLLKWWDYSKNKIDPNTIYYGTKIKCYWKCYNNPSHCFMLQVRKMVNNKSKCPQCSRSKVKIGFKRGKIEIIEELPNYIIKNSKPIHMVKAQCICGNQFIKETKYFISNKNPCCDNCKYETLIRIRVNDIVGDLTIIKLTKEIATCKCICNNIIELRRQNLLQRRNTNCGCKPNSRWWGTDVVPGTYFNSLEHSAKKRNLIFNITIQEISDLYIKQNGKCALTNLSIYLNRSKKVKNTASLDRIDSNKGYTIDNVQWVHKDINNMKMNKNQDYFIELCKLIYLHSKI